MWTRKIFSKSAPYLVHRVDGLEDLAADLVVEAELGGVGDAVDLHVVDALPGLEAWPPRHRVPVHRRQLALSRLRRVLRRPAQGVVLFGVCLYLLKALPHVELDM